MSATRQPRRGEWVMLDDGSIGETEAISRQSVYPTLWLKPKFGQAFPTPLRKPYDFVNLTEIGVTHRFTFTRNIYFRGFSAHEMTRDVILLAWHFHSEVAVVVDAKTMRRDSVLMTDVSEVVHLKYPIAVEAFDYQGTEYPQLGILKGQRVVSGKCGGFEFGGPTDFYSISRNERWSAREYKQHLATWDEIERCYGGLLPLNIAIYDAMKPHGLDERQRGLWRQDVQWALKCREAEARLGASTGIINYWNWGEERMKVWEFTKGGERPEHMDFWIEYTRKYGLVDMLDNSELQWIVKED